MLPLVAPARLEGCGAAHIGLTGLTVGGRQVERWLQIGKEHINVLLKGKDPIVQSGGKWPKAAITICSYDLCKRKQQELTACKRATATH